MTETAIQESFRVGDLVRVRGREWVVLPDSSPDFLQLRPLGGLDEETTGVLTALESVEPARFEPPQIEDLGSHASSKLLLQAARLSTRAAAGPFRSFGRIACEPRPYQLVPLMMALRQETTRLLIADDVGIGKTIEACLIAKELLERGEANGLAVVCPAHLAEQWQRELRDKFHIEADLVLPSTVHQLESTRRGTESVFQRHRFVIVSIDFIKANRRIDDFVQHCPDLVIVDEAHSCALGAGVGQARHQRNRLIQRLAEDPERHLLLVTATPHSGKEESFRSLIGLLDREFEQDPDTLDDKGRDRLKRKLARHLVQRRRGDITSFLGETEFPVAEEREATYRLTPAYAEVLGDVLDFTSGLVGDESGDKRQRRVRWWSALALLRSLASSPAAAVATMRKRADNLEAKSEAEADEIGRRGVLDMDDGDSEEASDLAPAGLLGEGESPATQRRLRKLAESVGTLFGPGKDAKLKAFTTQLKGVLADGNHPIVFCRFIDTAEYLAEHLRAKLGAKVEVAAVTGKLPPKEREDRVLALNEHEKRVLVCTDCLSEGVNLQEDFDAVLHYDLSWNPTRHEQREGRVDRFGQPRPTVRVLTYHGEDNLIDVVVLKVLHRKARAIRSRLGVSVSLPASTSEVIEHLYEEVLSRMRGKPTKQLMLDFEWSGQRELHDQWEVRAAAVSRSIYAQQTIKPEEVQAELEAVRQAIGAGPAVGDFLRRTFPLAQAPVEEKRGGRIQVEVGAETPRALRAAIARDQPFRARFELPVDRGEFYLARTHPIVEGLASWVLDTALDPETRGGFPPLASRCGVSKCSQVTARTNLLLLRIRFHLHPRGRGGVAPLLAEEILPVAYTGPAAHPTWLTLDEASSLLDAPPAGNVSPDLAKGQAESLLEALPALDPALGGIAAERAEALGASHTRVRAAGRILQDFLVEPVLPVDVLGAYVLLPA